MLKVTALRGKPLAEFSNLPSVAAVVAGASEPFRSGMHGILDLSKISVKYKKASKCHTFVRISRVLSRDFYDSLLRRLGKIRVSPKLIAVKPRTRVSKFLFMPVFARTVGDFAPSTSPWLLGGFEFDVELPSVGPPWLTGEADGDGFGLGFGDADGLGDGTGPVLSQIPLHSSSGEGLGLGTGEGVGDALGDGVGVG